MKIFNLFILTILFCNNIFTSENNELEIIQQTDWYQKIVNFTIPQKEVGVLLNQSLDDLFSTNQNQHGNGFGSKKRKKNAKKSKGIDVDVNAVKDFVILQTNHLLDSWKEVIEGIKSKISEITDITDFLYTNTDEDKDFLLSGIHKTDQRLQKIIDDVGKLFTKAKPSDPVSDEYKACRTFLKEKITKSKREKFINTFKEICENFFLPLHKSIEDKNYYFDRENINFLRDKIRITQKKIAIGIKILKKRLEIDEQTFNEKLGFIKTSKPIESSKYDDIEEFQKEIDKTDEKDLEKTMKTRIFARIFLYLQATEIEDLANYNPKTIDYISYAEKSFAGLGMAMAMLGLTNKENLDMTEHTLVVNTLQKAYILHILMKKSIAMAAQKKDQGAINEIKIEKNEIDNEILNSESEIVQDQKDNQFAPQQRDLDNTIKNQNNVISQNHFKAPDTEIKIEIIKKESYHETNEDQLKKVPNDSQPKEKNYTETEELNEPASKEIVEGLLSDIINLVYFNSDNKITILDSIKDSDKNSELTQNINPDIIDIIETGELTTNISTTLDRLGIKKQETGENDTTEKDRGDYKKHVTIKSLYNTSSKIYHTPIIFALLLIGYFSRNTLIVQNQLAPLFEIMTKYFSRMIA